MTTRAGAGVGAASESEMSDGRGGGWKVVPRKYIVDGAK